MKFRSPHTGQLADEASERVRRQHESAIRQLQDLPFANADIIEGVELVDGVATPIAHKLGRRPRFVSASCPRGATTTGRIEEVRAASSAYDRTKTVVLKAIGFTSTITVDVVVA